MFFLASESYVLSVRMDLWVGWYPTLGMSTLHIDFVGQSSTLLNHHLFL